MEISRRTCLSVTWMATASMLSGCPKETKLCEDGGQCCAIQTGESTWSSSCVANQDACSDLVAKLPQNGEYPKMEFPASNNASRTKGCR